jgi:hypothetical protein
MRKAAFAIGIFFLLAAPGVSQCAERLDLGNRDRKFDDPLIAAMDAAAGKYGMDGVVLVSIASVVEDVQAMRLSQTLDVLPRGRTSGVRAVINENERTGIYGYEDRAWLKVAPPLVSVTRSDEKAEPRKPKPPAGAASAAGRRRILDLRQDPVFATEVTASALHDALPAFRKAIGRDPSPGEMLDIHLFGVDAATRLTKVALKDSITPSSAVLGSLARRPSLRLFLTSTDGRVLSARALVISSEVAMTIKARLARRLLSRLRA